jgi:glycosyltransferase involved in cell wall biosynthesis
VPTGIDLTKIALSADARQDFRSRYHFDDDDIVVGTLCVIRVWKGINDMLGAADHLRENPRIKWLVVGDGPSRDYHERCCRELGLEEKVIFTGYEEEPLKALAAMDIFALLSTGHEGVSQASLQAAHLGKPLVTTTTGGLGEVCLDGVTGFQVPSHSPQDVAEAVQRLLDNPSLREEMGVQAQALVAQKFSWEKTLDVMEKFYR